MRKLNPPLFLFILFTPKKDRPLVGATPRPKNLKTFGGVALLVNTIMGAGIPLLPSAFQQAGLVVSCLATLVVAVVSGFAATMLAESMKFFPTNNNVHFSHRVEYSTLCKTYLGAGPFWMAQVLLNLSLLSMNLVSILLTVQVMDWTIVRIFGCTCGLILAPDHGGPDFGFRCVCFLANQCSHGDSPFQNAMVVGLGFVVVVCMIIPLSCLNLEDNILVQVVSCVIQIGIIIQWIVTFFMRGLDWEGSAVAPGSFSASAAAAAQGALLGQVILNYAFVVAIPSWCNDKHHSSSVNTTVWTSVGFSTGTFLIVGVLGALAFPNLNGESILTAINRATHGSLTSQISVYLFPLIAVASSIPVFCIIVRQNLVENDICRLRWANVWAVILPWILAIPLTAGNEVFNSIATYTSIVFLAPINFLVPLWTYIVNKGNLSYVDSASALSSMSFSERYPCLSSRIVPRALRIYLDKERPSAPEHFALPACARNSRTRKRAIVLGMMLLLGATIVFSLAMSIWQSVNGEQSLTNATSC